jgi:hypothetical protein
MKLMAAAVFGAGYVLGSKAGRERYEQIRLLARKASRNIEASGARERLEAVAAQLDKYSSQAASRHTSAS